jgi:RHS repeat-associated protein
MDLIRSPTWHETRTRLARSAPGYTRTYTYDDVLRPTRIITQMDGLEFVQDYAYGRYHGHVEGIRYPGGEIVAFDYDRHGYRVEERDPTRGVVYRRIEDMTPDSQVARERFGNGLTGRHEHIASTGQLRGVQVTDAAGTLLQDLGYEYGDPYGNLTRRWNGITGADEAFTYDALQRLDSATRTWDDGRAPVVIDYDYDALGNLVRKDDFGLLYQYGHAARSNPARAGPHAVMAVTRPDGSVVSDFAYDGNGNMLAGNGRQVRYDVANKPIEIRQGGVTTRFWYGPDQARYKQTRAGETTYYVGKDYEYIIAGGQAREKTYIGGYLVIEQSAAGRRVRYAHGDRMGSVDTITDEHGAVIERHGYDAFGKPLTSGWEDAGGLLHGGEYATATTTRGFSAHEHLDAHGLIHMNGRAYDPALGRFLSVDPFIQNPLNSQSLNPYSYVLNNPLSGVDPTGYECDPVDGDSAGCVDSDGNINEPATAEPGQNGQQGQGVGTADSGPAVDQGRPGKPVKDCGGSGCVTLPNTVKRTVVDGEVHYDFDFDFDGIASPDDGKASLGTGRGLVSLRMTVDQIKALDGALIVGMVLSGMAGAAKAALGRLYQGIASRTSGALSSAMGRLVGRLRTLGRAKQAAARGGQRVSGPVTQLPKPQVRGLGNIGNHGPMRADEALRHGQTWLGKGYKEVGPKGSGVFRSADGTRQFRMTNADLAGSHGNMGSHIHFEALDARGKVIENLHVPLIE